MKTLVSCTPREFLKQTNRIRHRAKNWLTLTKILEIRKTLPKLDSTATQEERTNALWDQVQKNLDAILHNILEEYPDETAELMGLICFIEPDDIDNHEMREIFKGFSESMSCPEVTGFFTSLIALGQMNTSEHVKA